MAIQETQLVVTFGGGIETKKDKKGVLPGKMLALENAVFTGETTLGKRNGYESLGRTVVGSTTALPDARALASRGTELLACSADKLWSRVEGFEGWVEAGEMRSVITSHRPVAKTGTNQTLAEVTVNDGIALYAWEDSAGGVWYELRDEDTDRSLVVPTQAHATGQRPRCIALGVFLFLVFALPTTRELKALRFSTSNPTGTPQLTTLTTDLSPTVPVYDLSRVDYGGTDDVGLMAWSRDAASIGVAYLQQTGSLGGGGLPSPTNVAGVVASAIAAAKVDASHVVLAYTEGLNVQYVTLDEDFASVHAARTVATEAAAPTQLTVAFDGNGTASAWTLWVVYELSAAAAQNYQVKAVKTDTAAGGYTAHDSWTQRGQGLASKAFTYGGDTYVHTGRDSTLYRTYYLQRADGQLVVARFLSGLGNGHLARAHLPTVVADTDDADKFFWPAIYVVDVDTPEEDVFSESGLRRIDIDFDSPEAFRATQLGATTYLAGGLLHAYDGTRVVEAGFHYGVDDVAAPTESAATGDGLHEGTFGYVFVLENILANGEVERGPVSAVTLVETTAAARRLTFAIPTYRLTAKPNARIAVYRSEDGDDAIYRRVSSLDPSTAGGINGYVANDTTVDTVAFIDEMPDGDDGILLQEPLYTTGNVVANDPLGGAKLIAGGRNRIFVVDGADPLAIYYSQELAEGYAAEFSPRLRMTVDPYGGAITAIAVRDGLIDVFKETATFTIGGSGPSGNPESGEGWTPAQPVTTDVGCIATDSTAYTPVGTVFQSHKGIRLIDRSGQTLPVGDPAYIYKSQTITAATLIQDETQIRFLSSDGSSLLFDYARNEWSVFANHQGLDAIVVDGTYHYLRTDGTVWRETPGVYVDGGARIPMAMETAWLKLGGHQQAGMYLWFVQFIGKWLSNHRLKMYIGFDYQEGWYGDPIMLDPAESRTSGSYGDGPYGDGPYGGVTDHRYQFEVHIGQECEAVRFRFEDHESYGDYGAAYELSELILIGGVERSHYALEEARRY